MTEKEKAKAYDDAIERAKKLHDKIDVEEIFPELNESEDERIKKAIIEFFESEDDNTTYSLVRKKDIIAWLEKQGEQYPSQTNERAWLYLVSDVLTWKDGIGKYLDDQRVQELSKRLCSEYARRLYNPSVLSNSSDTGKNEQNSTDKIEPIFKVGDWVVNKFGDSWYIDSLDKKNYQVSDGKGNYNYFPISKQDEMHLWTIQDAKDGDIICYRDEISLYKNEIENCNKQDTTFGGFVYYCCYDGKRFITNSFYLLTGQDEIDIYPATKEQRDLLFQKMKEAGYEWDTKKKELKKKRKR